MTRGFGSGFFGNVRWGHWRKHFAQELLRIGRFGTVGLVSTAIHITIVVLAIKASLLSPIIANTIAFFVAFSVSFTGNYIWTFRAPGRFNRALKRFFLISATAFAANTLLLAFLLRLEFLSPLASAIVSASLVPAISYTASCLWAFR